MSSPSKGSATDPPTGYESDGTFRSEHDEPTEPDNRSGIRNGNMHPSEPGSHHVISLKSDGTFYSSAQNHNEPGASDRVEPPPIQPHAFGLPPPPPGAILKPRDRDVLLGRGRPFHLHPGNQFMHKIVDHHKPGYLQSRRLDKIQIAILIVKQIQNAGGRFLKKDEDLIYWYPQSDSVARKKVSHLLRERPNKSQREVVDAGVKAAARTAKAPPVNIEPNVAMGGGIQKGAAGATTSSFGGTNASVMSPPTLSNGAGYGIGRNQNLGQVAAPTVPHAGGYVPHHNGNGIGGYVHPPLGPPGHFLYGAPHHGNNAVASHSALLASYRHHRSMIEYHMRQLAQHPFHTAPGSQPFKMPPLPPPTMGLSMSGVPPAQPDKSGMAAVMDQSTQNPYHTSPWNQTFDIQPLPSLPMDAPEEAPPVLAVPNAPALPSNLAPGTATATEDASLTNRETTDPPGVRVGSRNSDEVVEDDGV